MLAAELGHVVSMDRLVDGLWYDPPASAVNVVQVQVSHLRKQLPAPVRLETAGAGYRLDASARHVDLARFEALVNEAAAAERQGLAGANVEVLEEALALWKGDPLEGVGDLPFVEPLRRALLERRGRAEERLAALLVEQGRAREAVDHLEVFVARTPYDEHRWALLARALGSSGRSADGLEALQRARRRLVEDLGMDPGPEIRAAEQDLLRLGDGPAPADPWAAFAESMAAADGPAAVPVSAALAPFSGRACVGRDQPLQELDALCAPDRVDGDRVAVVVAEPGAGKTHLLAALAARVGATGAVTLYGRHSPERYLPYEAWGQILSAAVQQLPPGFAPALPLRMREPLARLVPAFAGDGTGADAEVDPTSRFRLFEAVADLLSLVAEVVPVVVLVDDLQWAGTSSVALTRSVLSRGLPDGLRVVLASRPDPEDNDAAGLLAELHEQAVPVSLPGLDATAAHELLRLHGLECSLDDAGRIAALSAGNPLVMQQFRSFDGSSFIAELGGVEPSARAEALVDERFEGFAPATRALLEAASLAGIEFTLDEVQAVTGVPEHQLVDDLEPALHRGVVLEHGGDDRLAFGHALYQSVLRRRVSGPRRRRGHRALALHATASGRVVAAAYHAFEAGGSVAPDELHRFALAAADRLAADLAPDKELDLLDRLAADPLVAASLRDAERFELDLRRARLRCVCGDWDGSREQYLAVAEEARRLGAVDVLPRVALEIDDRGRSVRLVGPRLGLLDEARRRFGDAGDLALRIELDAAWAGEVNQFGRGGAAVAGESLVAFADEVVTRARDLGQPHPLAAALFTRQSVGHWQGDIEGNRLLLDELLELAAALGDDHLLHVGLLGRLRAGIQAGDREAAEEFRRRHAALAETTGHPRTTWFAMMQRSTLAQMDGAFDEAEALALEAVAYGMAKDIPDADGAFKAALYFNLFHAQRTAEVRSLVEDVVVAEPHNPLWRIGAGIAQAEAGDQAAAQASLDTVVDLLARLPRNEFWPSVLTMAADLADRLPPDPARAAALEALLAPWSGRFVVMGSMITTLGPADRALALLACEQGDLARAEALLAEADALCDRLGAAAWSDRVRDVRERRVPTP